MDGPPYCKFSQMVEIHNFQYFEKCVSFWNAVETTLHLVVSSLLFNEPRADFTSEENFWRAFGLVRELSIHQKPKRHRFGAQDLKIPKIHNSHIFQIIQNCGFQPSEMNIEPSVHSYVSVHGPPVQYQSIICSRNRFSAFSGIWKSKQAGSNGSRVPIASLIAEFRSTASCAELLC